MKISQLAEQEPQFSAALLAAQLEGSPDGILVADHNRKIVLFNRRFGEMWRIPESVVAAGSDDVVLKAGTEQLKDPQGFYDRVIHLYDHPDETGNEEIEFKDGRIFERYSASLYDSNRKNLGRVWLFHDVTDKRNAEMALRDSRQILEGILNTIPVRVFWKNADLEYLGCNAAFARDAGFADPKDVVGKDDYQMGWRDQAKLYRADDQRVIESGIPRLLIEEPQTTPEGKKITLLTSKLPLRGPDGSSQGVLGTYLDITDRKQAEEALRQSQESLTLATKAAQIGIWDWDIVADRLVWDARMYEIYGVRAQEFSGAYAAWQAGLHPDDRARSDAAITAAIEGLKDFSIEFRVRRPSGEVRHVEAHALVQRASNGRATRMVGVNWDITERKRAEQTIRSQAAQYDTVVATSADGYYVVDVSGTFVDAGPAYLRMTGYSREELLRLHVRDIDVVETGGLIARHIESIKVSGFDRFETRQRRKDGSIFDIEVSVSYWRDGDLLLCFGRDITEHKRALSELSYRDRILHAVTQSAAELVSGSSLATAMPHALRIAGEAMRVNRILVFERLPAAGDTPAMSLLFSWQKQGAPQQNPASLTAYPANSKEIADWLAPLTDGKAVVTYADAATGIVGEIMRERGALSTLMVPISVAGKAWGQIGVDDSDALRRWTSVDIDAVGTLAEVVGALIMRGRVEASLQMSEARFRAVSETAQDAILMIDEAGRIQFWNRAAERILGYSAAEAVGKPAAEWLALRDAHHRPMLDLTESERSAVSGRTSDLWATRKDGVEIPIELSISTMSLGTELYDVGVIRDITERKRANDQIIHMARHDHLTGLANRAVFVESLQQPMARARRGGMGFAVLYLDLDHFKDVNDTLGHPVGDLLLQAVAKRLQAAIREIDTVARFGGDEFAVIEADIDGPADAAILADAILKVIAQPFAIQGHEIRTGASVGIAVYGADSADAERLLAHADVALYRAKSEGRGTYRFFTDAMDLEVRTRVTLGAELRSALTSGQLFLMYQPQIDSDTGRILGVEAVVRWHHPKRGLVLPGEFIPAAEQSGLIVALGRWVLREACRQGKEWIDSGIVVPVIAVNVSGVQLKIPGDLESDIAAILAETALPPGLLELELTESVLMETSRERNDVLLRLRKSGLRLAIDDFGTGYSSLDYLGRFPVDRLKIAQNFVIGLKANSGSAAIVKAAISLAHDLAIGVIVEGVETAEQLALVRSWGGREVQGFYFSKPLSAVDTAAVLRVGTIPRPELASGAAAHQRTGAVL